MLESALKLRYNHIRGTKRFESQLTYFSIIVMVFYFILDELIPVSTAQVITEEESEDCDYDYDYDYGEATDVSGIITADGLSSIVSVISYYFFEFS